MNLASETAKLDLPTLIRGRSVYCTGKLASMGREDFVELIESYGGRCTNYLGKGTGLVVIGQREWPLTVNGRLPESLRKADVLRRRASSSVQILSEEQFLAALGLGEHRQVLERTYSTTMLADVLEVSRERISAWVKAGLLKPNFIEHGVWHFDFKQVSAAKTLCDLARRGVTVQRIRRSLEHLRCWLPEAEEPLQRLATLNDDGRLLVRLADGDLAGLDGQLHFDFTEEPALPTMRITPGPRTAAEWYEQGLDQESQGYFADAEDCYRQALSLGGPDARICFSLANVLRAAGQKDRALERYRQTVEIDPTFADAWNNLGVLLAELEQRDEACAAFRKALEADAFDLRAHYNLADTLEDMGKPQEALVHWQAYLRQDPVSAWGRHARSRAVATCPF